MIWLDDEERVTVRQGVDTDQDGRPDTLVLPDSTGVNVLADVDQDGFADMLIRLGQDGVATTIDLAGPVPWWPIGLADDACYALLELGQP